ncbi:MAG: ABC transporter ATP-binding protein [Desulfobacteraceae bacterium]|jgi:ATP-binding cassette subfamily B protein
MKPIDLIWSHFKTHRRTIALGLCALIIVDIMQLSIPRVVKRVVDDLTLLRADAASLIYQAAAVAAMALFIGAFRYVWRLCLLGTARRLEETLRNRLLKHVQTLSATYFDGAKTGDLMAHATNDIQQVRMAAGMGLVAFNDALLLGAAAIGFMLYIHVELTLYVLIPMPVLVLGTRFLGTRMHVRYRKVQAAFADLTEAVRERFAGIRMIKAHQGETAAGKAVQRVSQTYINENIKLVGVTGLFFPMMLLLTNLSLALVLFFGGRRTILLEITAGDFVAFISYLNLLAWPMMALGWVTNLIQRGGASLERLKNILELRPDIRSKDDAKSLTSLHGRIEFKDVSFVYDQHRVLDHIDLRVAPGEIVGIVGPPGSGKSTLLNLVPRLYDVQKGRLTVDDHDVRDLSLVDLRRHIAHVPQEPFLFAGTIGENLCFGCPDGCTARLDQVLFHAGLEKTISGFQDGLDTVVGEKGILLSGGQKQRIALARALLIDAPILLLDDPISQVDTVTGGRITDTIKAMMGKKTILIVSHRLSAVRFAHRIITIEAGRLSESGSHEQLVAGGGYYARVHALQELEDAV